MGSFLVIGKDKKGIAPLLYETFREPSLINEYSAALAECEFSNVTCSLRAKVVFRIIEEQFPFSWYLYKPNTIYFIMLLLERL